MNAHMTAPVFNGTFPHRWQAEILAARPLVLSARHFVYPGEAERWNAAHWKCWFGPIRLSALR